VFENSIDGIITFLPDGTMVSCNPAAGQLFGCVPAGLIGQRLNEQLDPFPHAQPVGLIPIGLHETVARRADGAAFPVEVTISESWLKGQRQMIAFIRDITERKGAQDRLALLANYDSLTGSPNRTLFRDCLRKSPPTTKTQPSPRPLLHWGTACTSRSSPRAYRRCIRPTICARSVATRSRATC
jgi:PAS domain S-box-containing protein